MEPQAGSIPTITASGVPQATLRPLWLFRQTIFIGLAGGGGGVRAAWRASRSES